MKVKITVLVFCLSFLEAHTQDKPGNFAELFGYAALDMGYNFNQLHPQWYDVMRPSKLPSYKNEFGSDGNIYLSARQSHFGIKTSNQTSAGELKTIFDFDLFGVGPDAGQTTIWLHHAYGQLGHFGAGQTESAFMDLDVLPASLEYWGPCGTLFFRNVQVRWIPILGPTHLMFAFEQPGATADKGAYANRIELANIKPRFPLPDFSGHYRKAYEWGYIQLGGIARYIEWQDQNNNDTLDLNGHVVGWGFSFSTKIAAGKNNIFHLQGIYGAGIENYFNDAPEDVGIKSDFSNRMKPVKGKALSVTGIVAFLDHTWSGKWSSSIGYSATYITNTDGQAPSAFRQGQYALINVVYHPVPDVTAGMELQWIDRRNFNDGFSSSATKINFSFKYNFSQKI